MGNEIESIPPVSPAEFFGDEREGFDRLDGESKREFAWFDHYRRAGRRRSYGEVAQYHGVSREAIQKAGTKHSWVQRARSFDAYQDEHRAAELDGQQLETRENHLVLLAKIRKRIDERMDKLGETEIQARDLPAYIELALKYERLNAGLGDAPKKIEITGKDGAAIEVVNNLSAADRKEWLAGIQATIQAQIEAQQGVLDADIEEADIVDG